MGLIATQEHLTILDDGFEQMRNRTQPGMAHFAATGPQGKTCRDCIFWTGCGVQHGYYAKKGKFGGTLKPRPCAKHKELMGGEVGPAVPHSVASCKYFNQAAEIPTLNQK